MKRRVRPIARCQRHFILTLSVLCSPWLLGGCAEVPAPPSQIAALPTPAPAGTIDTYIHEAAQKFNVPERWIHAVMQQESGGRTHFHGQPIVSQKGAMGLMQVMPETWAYLRAAYGLGNDPFDPHDNILAGTAYIREMYDQYGTPGFLAAYNAGPGRYELTLKTHRPLPDETKHYMAVISPQIAGIEPDGASPTPHITTVAALSQRSSAPAHSAMDGDPDAKPAPMVVAVLPAPTPPAPSQPKRAVPAVEPAPAAATAKPVPSAPPNRPAPVVQLASVEAVETHPAPHPVPHPSTVAAAHSDPHPAHADARAHTDARGELGDTVVSDRHLPNGLIYADHRTNLPPGWYVPVAYTH